MVNPFSAWRNVGQLLGVSDTLEESVRIAAVAIPQAHKRPGGDEIIIRYGQREVLSFSENREATS